MSAAPPFALRLVAAACLVVLVGIGLQAARWAAVEPLGAVRGVAGFVRAGVEGLVFCAVLQLLLMLTGAVPASLIAIASGAVYGLLPGFLVAGCACMARAAAAFGLSCSVFAAQIASWLIRLGHLQSLDAAIAGGGSRTVALLRLSPVMPFAAASYLLGISSLRFADFLAGTAAALAPLFGYVFLGTLTDANFITWTGEGSPLRWLLFAVGAGASTVLLIRLGTGVLRHWVAPTTQPGNG